MPDVKKDTRAGTTDSRVGIVRDKDTPAIEFVVALHLFRAVPILLCSLTVKELVVAAGLRIIHAFHRRRKRNVLRPRTRQRLRTITKGNRQRENTRWRFPIALVLDGAIGGVFTVRLDSSSPAQASLSHYNRKTGPDWMPQFLPLRAFIALCCTV